MLLSFIDITIWCTTVSINLHSYRHCVYKINLHIVFVTKYRRKVINAQMLERMKEIFERLCQNQKSELIEFGGESDHVHLLVDFHPRQSISAVAGSLKAATSRMVKKEFPVEFSKWYSKQSFWSGSYYVASSGGSPIEKLKEYIKNQDAPLG